MFSNFFFLFLLFFKFRLARLELLTTVRGLHFWDTSSPPDLEKCLPWPTHLTSPMRFRTIEPRKITAITLIFHHVEIYAIHAHTPLSPCTKPSISQLSPELQRSAVWIYIPNPQGTLFFGVWKAPLGSAVGLLVSLFFNSFRPSRLDRSNLTERQFQLKLAGDVIVHRAPIWGGATFEFRMKASPVSLIHDVAEDLLPISVIGAYSEPTYDLPMDPEFRSFTKDPPIGNSCFSVASLDNVHRVSVFYHEQMGFCVGMLLEYENGGQRSLGQCRIGVDPVTSYRKPARICLLRRRYPEGGAQLRPRATNVRISERDECEHKRDEGGQDWTCFPMRGALEFWFSSEETQLTVNVDRHLH